MTSTMIRTCLGLLLLITLTAAANTTTTTTTIDDCPLDCHCEVLQRPRHIYNHAKCTSLQGLRQIGKTSVIQSLDCSGIGATKITGQLDKLTNLTRLDLSHNELTEVTKLSKRIRSLNLSHNRITSGKLSKIPPFLHHLNLSYNELTYLPLELMQLSRLMSIELVGNPLNCTCETLQVRNWLQSNTVWSDSQVVCTSPIQFKGKSWLQVKHADVCGQELKDDSSFENELMLGDQPQIYDDGSGETKADSSPIEEDFLPLGETHVEKHSNTDLDDIALQDEIDGSGDNEELLVPVVAHHAALTEYEGSGDENSTHGALIARIALPVEVTTTTTTTVDPEEDYDEDEEDGSGSGGGILDIQAIVRKIEFTTTTEADDEDDYEEEESTYVPQSLDIFGKGILKESVESTTTTTTTTKTVAPVIEEVIVPIRKATLSANLPETTVAPTQDVKTSAGLEDGRTQETEESRSTYILLVILAILFLSLIVFVIVKRKKTNQRNRRNKSDVESPTGTELQSMDKKLLGKPTNGNGNVEFIPLVGNRDKWSGRPTNGTKDDELNKAQEPLLKKLAEVEPEENSMQTFRPATPPTEKAPENNNNNLDVPVPAPRREELVPVHQPTITNGHPNSDDEVFLPVSPKPSRYSPVYSPDTGRVKIKLTETPKPRTPMLVTRSRSNAGHMITTPNLSLRPPLQKIE